MKHIKDTENKSLLTRIYGLFRIKKTEGKVAPVDLVVIYNLNKDVSTEKIRYQFLLMGLSKKSNHKNPKFDVSQAIKKQ